MLDPSQEADAICHAASLGRSLQFGPHGSLSTDHQPHLWKKRDRLNDQFMAFAGNEMTYRD